MSNAETTAPALTVDRTAGGELRLQVAGDWSRPEGAPSFGAIYDALGDGSPPPGLLVDASGLKGWGSSLLSRLARCDELCAAKRIPVKLVAVPEGLVRLLRLARAVPEKVDARREQRPRRWLEGLGELALAGAAGAADFVQFLGECVLAAFRWMTGRAHLRWSDALLVMQETGPRALGIVALINFLVGLILAFVGAVQLARFGASVYVADLVAVATVREMGCIMTAIIMCGRTGAAFAAQLGTMKVNEEIDAFTTFGFPPAEFLVLPRLLALGLMMPFLCAFANLIAISGGLVVATSLLDLSATDYINRTIQAITLNSFLLGIFKGACFGVLVALVGCWRGMRCGSDAAAVGEATTSAVVIGISGIIAADGLFAVLTNALNI